MEWETKKLPLRFYPFFTPQNLLKKEKANFVSLAKGQVWSSSVR